MEIRLIGRLSFVVLFAIASECVFGQVNFTRLPSYKGIFNSYSQFPINGGGMSFADFNNDGWDDITLTSGFDSPVHFYENRFGSFVETTPLSTYNSAQYFSVWIDYDNDGDKDFLSISSLLGIQLFKCTGPNNFVDVTSISNLSSFLGAVTKGGVCGDFNNDGLIDIYVCSYSLNQENRMYFQDSNNVFHDVTSISGTGNGFKASFQAVLIDYNNDGLIDFYVANDLDHGNTLYRNNGDSTFTDVSIETGAYLELDAMGLAVGDYDGDLDLDIHITDRINDSKLLRNNNDGTFTEVGTEMGLDFAGGFGWGNNFFDMDLDGDEDLYISGIFHPAQGLTTTPSALNINNNNDSFTVYNIPGDTLFSISNVLGDFNNDRLTDIAVHNSANTPATIWVNETNPTNQAISLNLEGCSSNKDGIGAKLYTYSNSISRLYSFHGSQSFLGQSSSTFIVPIVNALELDSLKVFWPSGIHTTLYGINPNQTIVVSECSGHRPQPVILAPNYHDQGLTICGEDSILLAVNGNYPSVTWSNGETSDSIYVTSGGTYTVLVTNQFGESAISSPVTINALGFPQFSIVSEPSSCFNNGEIEIVQNDTTHAYQYAWSVGDTTRSIIGLSPGTYAFTVTNEGECPVIDSFFVEGPQSYSPMHIESTTHDALCYGEASGIVDLYLSGGFEPYCFEWNNGMSESSISVVAGTHRVTITDSFGCQKDTLFIIDQPDLMLADIQVTPDTNLLGLGSIEMIVMGGTPPISIFWSDSANQTGSVAANLRAGNYNASIVDANFCQREIPIKVTNVNTTGQTAAFNTSCSVKCVNQAQSILVSFHENCEAINSKSEIDVFNMHGQKIRRTLNAIDAHTIELFTEQNGIIFIDAKQGGTCKVVRF